MNKYNEALNLCLAEDSIREFMLHPFVIENYAYATNAYILLKVPLEKTENIENIKNSPIPDILKIFPIKSNMPLDVKLSAIYEAIDKVEKIAELKGHTIVCEECNGDGEVECPECGCEHECKKCHGEGYLDEFEETGRLIPNPKSSIKIVFNGFDIVLSAGKLQTICEVCEKLDVKTLKLVAGTRDSALLFELNDCELIIMPLLSQEGECICIETL